MGENFDNNAVIQSFYAIAENIEASKQIDGRYISNRTLGEILRDVTVISGDLTVQTLQNWLSSEAHVLAMRRFNLITVSRNLRYDIESSDIDSSEQEDLRSTLMHIEQRLTQVESLLNGVGYKDDDGNIHYGAQWTPNFLALDYEIVLDKECLFDLLTQVRAGVTERITLRHILDAAFGRKVILHTNTEFFDEEEIAQERPHKKLIPKITPKKSTVPVEPEAAESENLARVMKHFREIPIWGIFKEPNLTNRQMQTFYRKLISEDFKGSEENIRFNENGVLIIVNPSEVSDILLKIRNSRTNINFQSQFIETEN